jgi:hypothetical protein
MEARERRKSIRHKKAGHSLAATKNDFRVFHIVPPFQK